MDAIKAEGGWSDISFPNDRAFKYNPHFLVGDAATAPVVLNVTAGGGSSPFEAGRLGFRTIANDRSSPHWISLPPPVLTYPSAGTAACPCSPNSAMRKGKPDDAISDT